MLGNCDLSSPNFALTREKTKQWDLFRHSAAVSDVNHLHQSNKSGSQRGPHVRERLESWAELKANNEIKFDTKQDDCLDLSISYVICREFE